MPRHPQRWTVLLVLLFVAAASMGQTSPPPYDRKLYLHWIDADHNCRTTRVEVLIRDSQPGTLQLVANGCTVQAGTWVDPYTGRTFTAAGDLDVDHMVPLTGRTFTAAGDLDVDHMVPLKHAHEGGAWAWSVEQRKAFANELGYRFHLLAVSSSANRSKGDRGPDQWRPENRAFWCQYAQAWATVKYVNGLQSTPGELTALREMLATC